jgi:hypothetical protein
MEKEVKYLGHLISEGKQRLSLEWISGIISMPLPATERELRKSLGLIGYCRLWIDSYALKTKGLYLRLLDEKPDPLLWKSEELQSLDTLKQALITTPVLSLPSLEKPFHLFVTVDKGTALGVLTQDHGGQRQPVIYLSKILDPVSRWGGQNVFNQLQPLLF